MTNTIKAEPATIEFCEGLNIDAYRMPSGEFRFGVTGASEILGYSKQWLGRFISGDGNRIKALQSLGFEGKIEVAATETSKGDRQIKTISLDDFNQLITYAVLDGKKPALLLQMALSKVALTTYLKDGFGEAPLTIEETRKIFYSTYAASVNWLEEDRNDRDELYGWSSPD